MHPPSNTEALTAVVDGEAVAAGQYTHTTGIIHSFAEDRGGYSIIMGDAKFEASAQSPTQGEAAVAASSLHVSGADFVIERRSDHGGGDPNHAWASSETDYVAIDIDGWSPPGGPVVIELPQSDDHLQYYRHEPLHGINADINYLPIDVCGWPSRGGPVIIEFPQPGDHFQHYGHQPPHGNNADVMAIAEAHGADSLAATFTNSLTIENHFSFVDASAMVVI